MIGENVFNYGISEQQVKDKYCGFVEIDQMMYYANTDRVSNNILFYVVLKDTLLRQRFPFALMAALPAFLFYLLTGVMIYSSRAQIEMSTPLLERRTDQVKSPSSEAELMCLLKYYAAFAAALVAITSRFTNDADIIRVLNYVRDGNWEKGFNVFAFTANLVIVCRGGTILFLIMHLVDRIKNIFSSRVGTIMKMIASLFSYVAIALLFYQCAFYFGLNPNPLMASTGIVAVILGIGAKSLVGDVLAGIFLLMEGRIQVGDVVQIDGFRGYVMEMDIRRIKLYDMETEYVKIIPNDQVRNVVHMSIRKAWVYSEFRIRYEEKLEDVERLLVHELEEVKDKSPLILEGPIYLGVSGLMDNGVYLKVKTKCHEASRRSVEREVNHIVYTIFQKYHIDVPARYMVKPESPKNETHNEPKPGPLE